MATLSDRLDRVLGGKAATVLAKQFDFHTVGDLVRHYPRRVVTRGDLTDLDKLRIGEHVTVLGLVLRVEERSPRRRGGKPMHILVATVTDGTATLDLTFFNQKWRKRDLHKDAIGLFSGKVDVFNGRRQLTHPDYKLLPGDGSGVPTDKIATEFSTELLPIYPATEKVPSWNLATSIRTALDQLDPPPDPIPDEVRTRRELPGLAEAIFSVHRPESMNEYSHALHRFRYEEAFVLQTELARRRHAVSALPADARVGAPGGLADAALARLPFDLTEGQHEVVDQITAELAGTHPMHRLLQGEVGAGKTVVALLAMLTVVESGGQAALLAPTEVLAHQHYRTITGLLGPLGRRGMLDGADEGTRVALITGSMPVRERREILLDIGVGDAGIVVGTHALLQESVQFFDLGLVVVDEQHRFGVEQRAALAGKSRSGQRPHVLVMTATPIPRTVAMTVFGDLEVTTLDQLPAGRAEVQTHVVPAAEKPRFLERTWERAREEVEAGHRVYVVCPRIGGDDEGRPDVVDDADAADQPRLDDPAQPKRQLHGVLELADQLRDGPLAGIPVGILHGRMTAAEKDQAMAAFAAGTVPVLVATTVIEVGVDVADASMMVVMDADRFGVSQLHQLRGRIGRGALPGVCLLVTEAEAGSPARDRVDAVAATRDGFALSQIDLEQRREGDVLGASQSGRRSSLRLLQVIRDEKVIADARTDASAVVAADPDLAAHPALCAAVDALAEEQSEFIDKD